MFANVRPLGADKISKSVALENQRAAKASAGIVFSGWMTNTSAIDLWLLLVDKASAAVDTDLPERQVLVPAGISGEVLPLSLGRRCVNGIVLVASTTPEVVTLPTAGNANKCWFDVAYR